MLTMFRAGSRSDGGSDTTEEIVREGYPYYFKKNNGRIVMARNISGRSGNKNFSLLGQAFGIHEPKRRSSIDTLRKKKKKPVRCLPRPQLPYSAPLPQQPFLNFMPPPPMPFAPSIPQQPFPSPNIFAPTNPEFPPFYAVPGFPPAPAPVPQQQPMRWAFPPKETQPSSIEELRKVESDFLKRARSKLGRDGDHDDHTEIKTTTTTTITKHICIRCRRDRSAKYHLDNPIRNGETPTPGFCRKCRRNATSTSGSSSDDSDDGGSRRHVDKGRGRGGRRRRKRWRERDTKKNDRRQPTSRLHPVEILIPDERRDNARGNDYRDETIVEEEVVRESKPTPKEQDRRSNNNSRISASRSYIRTRERDLVDSDSTIREEPKLRINIANRLSSISSPSVSPPSAIPPSAICSIREKSVHFDQPAARSNTSQTTSQRNIRKSYRYVEPLRFATSYTSLPKSLRYSGESLPSLHTRDHAQRRRTERAYPESTYDHDTHEQVREYVPRRRSDEDIIVVETEHEHPRLRTQSRTQPYTRPRRHSDEDIIVVETEHEQPRSRAESRNQPHSDHRPRHRFSDEDLIVVETEHEYPRFRAESRYEPRRPRERHRSPAPTPVRARETYITSEVDQHGNETQYKWTTSKASSSLSSAIGFIPSVRRTSTNVRRPVTVHGSSDSSEEYNRAYAMAHQNLPMPRPRRRQRSSFRSSGGFMDGANTPPQVPDPPTENGFWEPRNARTSASATQSRRKGLSTTQGNITQVPHHQSTPRGDDQEWTNASLIDELGQRLNQNRQSRVRSQSSDSQSSGSMVTQSDSVRTPSPSVTYELGSSNSTPSSMVPRPVSVHETTESGNEVESTSATPSPKAIIAKKSADKSHRRRNGRADVSSSQAKDHGQDIGSSYKKYDDQLGSYTSYVEYGKAAVASNGTNRSNANNHTQDNADDPDNATILDDATDLTLRIARSKSAMNSRINSRRDRVSFSHGPWFSPPEQFKDNSWSANTHTNEGRSSGANVNNNDGQSWRANADTNDGQSWGANTNTNGEQSWGDNTNADQSWGATTNGDQSWGAETNNTGNNFWSSQAATETVFPDVGSYSGPPSANVSNMNFNGNNTSGFFKKGFAPTPAPKTKPKDATGTGGDGNNDDGKGGKKKVEDEWGPIPTFSSLHI